MLRHVFTFNGTAICLWLASIVAVAADPIQVTVEGFGDPAFRGQLVSISSERISIKTDRGVVEKSATDVSRLEFPNKPIESTSAIELTFIDGSRTRGSKLTGKEQAWIAKDLTGQSTIPIPNQSLRAVLFKPLPSQAQSQWQTAIAETITTDAIIVMRSGNTLDRINGLITQIKDTHVVFDLDGQSIEVPIEKMVGLVWFRRGLERVKPTIEITLVDQSVWFAESFQWKQENEIEIKTQLGQTTTVPVSKIMRINYANAVIRWVAELESLDAVAENRLEFKTRIPTLEQSLAPRFIVGDRSSKTETTSLNPSEQDLFFPSPGRFVFRVPEGFTSFQSSIERNDQGSQRSELTITISQDDVVAWQGKLPANQDTVEINAPIKPEKKVKLVVACDSKLMIGTEVLWKQPRLKR